MPEPVIVALLVSTVGPAVLFGLNYLFGGRRKSHLEEEASVAAQWQAWSQEQGDRIEKLEVRVDELEKALKDEREINARLVEQDRRKSALLTSLIRWAILLRDEVIRLGGSVPPAPADVESALTTLEI